MEIDLEQLRELMRTIDEHGFDEIEIERNEERIAVRRHRGAAAAPVPQPGATLPVANDGTPSPPPASTAEEEDPNVVYISSPFVGTFYRAPSPGEAPFVEKGQEIETGQTLCIVEAMKLMNEIEAELEGTVLDVLAADGQPVEYGDWLFKVRKKT